MKTLEPTTSRLPAVLLTLLLLLLAFRLTCAETWREPISQKTVRIDAELHPDPDLFVPPDVGAPYFVGYATLMLLIAGAAAFCAGRSSALSAWRIGQMGLILLILGGLILSTWHAQGRFPASLGTADIAASLLAGWTIALLCQDELLGDRGRHAVIAAIVAVLALGCGKALMQHFSEFPETLAEYQQNPEKWFRIAGIPNEPVQRFLFEQRLKSAEVYGFGAMANVFAAQLIPLGTVLLALVMAGIYKLRRARGENARSPRAKSTAKASEREVPMALITVIGLGLVLIVALGVLVLTDSKGAIVAACIALCAVVASGLLWKLFVAWRRPLLVAGSLAVVAGAVVVIWYGRAHGGLPTKSLLFRWQYWTGAVPMIKQSPALGIGLNNFGDYYTQFKSPSSPEDVKDPHNFFVRLLAEAGVPATVLITAILLWFTLGALRLRKTEPEPRQPASMLPMLIVFGVGAFFWIPLHIAVHSSDAFTVSMTMIFAVIGWAIAAAVVMLLEEVTAAGEGSRHVLQTTRFFCLCGVIGALGMMFYDQVNMALVTGPVAMLFWMLLGLGDSYTPARATVKRGKSAAAGVLGGFLAVGGVAALFTVLIPVIRGTFPWDPAPHENAFVRAALSNNSKEALAQLDKAIELSPNSVELLMQRFGLKQRLEMPVADDIRRVLALDRANASVRGSVASPATDLPVSERIAALEDALRFNDALPKDEPKRLPEDRVDDVKRVLAELKKTSGG